MRRKTDLSVERIKKTKTRQRSVSSYRSLARLYYIQLFTERLAYWRKSIPRMSHQSRMSLWKMRSVRARSATDVMPSIAITVVICSFQDSIVSAVFSGPLLSTICRNWPESPTAFAPKLKALTMSSGVLMPPDARNSAFPR